MLRQSTERRSVANDHEHRNRQEILKQAARTSRNLARMRDRVGHQGIGQAAENTSRPPDNILPAYFSLTS
jgi:hypothetical protein